MSSEQRLNEQNAHEHYYIWFHHAGEVYGVCPGCRKVQDPIKVEDTPEYKQLEQQLAQAREDKQLYYDSWMHICKERDQAQVYAATMRALLEKACDWIVDAPVGELSP